MKHKVILRADGSTRIGFGHLYRLVALTEILHDDFDCTIVTDEPHQFLLDIVQSRSLSFVKVDTINYPSPDSRAADDEVPFDMTDILVGNEIVVTDGYWFGPNYQKKIKDKGCKLVCIDDLGEYTFVSDVIINHSPGAYNLNYKCERYTKLCIGLEYLLIRSIFLNKPKRNRQPQKIKRIFISVGGSDQYGFTPKLVEACILEAGRESQVIVLMTRSFQLETRIAVECLVKQGNNNIDIVENLGGEELCELLDTCTHAITPSSTIALEAIARGLKPLVGYYVNNQVNMFKGITEKGYGFPLGDFFERVNTDLIKQYFDHSQAVSSFAIKQKTKDIFNELANQSL